MGVIHHTAIGWRRACELYSGSMPAEYMIVIIFRGWGMGPCQSREVPAMQAKIGLEWSLDEHVALQAWNWGLEPGTSTVHKNDSENNVDN